MSNVYELPVKNELYDEASVWIAKIDRGLNAKEKAAFQDWISKHPSHKNVLFEMAALWDRMDSLSRLSSLFPPPAVEAPKARRKILPAMAASIIFALVCFSSAIYLNDGKTENLLAVFNQHHVEKVYETGIGEHSRVNLPDGSQIVLNTNSLIQVKYTKNSRLFHLTRGEVHIDVAHDKSRPLSVYARDKIVQAVGTAFNVQIFDDQHVELIVTDGKVLVAEQNKKQDIAYVDKVVLPKQSLAISQGEKILFGRATPNVEKIKASDIDATLSWREGNLTFRGETLEEALEEIARYTEVEFAFANDEIKKVRIAGLFKAGDIKGLLATLERNFHIEHERLHDDLVYLKTL